MCEMDADVVNYAKHCCVRELRYHTASRKLNKQMPKVTFATDFPHEEAGEAEANDPADTLYGFTLEFDESRRS